MLRSSGLVILAGPPICKQQDDKNEPYLPKWEKELMLALKTPVVDSSFDDVGDWIDLSVKVKNGNSFRQGLLAGIALICLWPEDSYGWFSIAIYMDVRHEYYIAAMCYLQVTKLQRKHVDGNQNLAWCLLELGEIQNSKKYARKVLKWDSCRYIAMRVLALCYFEEGKLALAKKWVLKALELEPEDEITHSAYEIIVNNHPAGKEPLNMFARMALIDDWDEAQINRFRNKMTSTQTQNCSGC